MEPHGQHTLTLATQIQVMMAPITPVMAPLMAPAAEILFQVMQKAIGGTALPTITPMNRYTQPRDSPIFLQTQTPAAAQPDSDPDHAPTRILAGAELKG